MPVMLQFTHFSIRQFTLFGLRQKQQHPVPVRFVKTEAENSLRGILRPVPGFRPDDAPEDGGFTGFQYGAHGEQAKDSTAARNPLVMDWKQAGAQRAKRWNQGSKAMP